jgi:hypothetical protein
VGKAIQPHQTRPIRVKSKVDQGMDADCARIGFDYSFPAKNTVFAAGRAFEHFKVENAQAA